MQMSQQVSVFCNAVTADIVDDDDGEPAVPPPVFLSYQWAHQPHVKLLKRHLGTAGYSCWMDVGQMGGGDKLFAKIDNGIRAAKLVICCVTEQYAQSPNCNREVIVLAVSSSSAPSSSSLSPIHSARPDSTQLNSTGS